MKKFGLLALFPLALLGTIQNVRAGGATYYGGTRVMVATQAALDASDAARSNALASTAAHSASSPGLNPSATLLPLAWDAQLALAQSGIDRRASYNVRDFGATGYGLAKDTAAIQQALDACAAAGGGEVLVPAGTYLTGSLELKSSTTLRLERDAVLQGSPDLEDYPIIKARWEGHMVDAHRALISANFASRITIIGLGKIIGHPALGGRTMPRRPCVIEPIECTDVRLEDITVTQSRMWTIHPTFCDEVYIKNVTIRSTGGNSDGIDVDSCSHVRIEGCDIESGDDCIAIKSGRGLEGLREARPSEDIIIRDCALGDFGFAGIGIGSETSGGIRGVRIEDCRFRFANTYAIYLKSRPGRGAFIEDITAQNLDVQTAPGGFLRINLLNSGLQDAEPVPGLDGIPAVKNLRFSNVKVNCGTLVDAASVSPEKPVNGFVLENITGTAAKGITLAHMTNVALAGINVTGTAGEFLSTANVTGTGLDQALPGNPAEHGVPGTNTGPAAPRQARGLEHVGTAAGNGAASTRVTLWNGRDLAGWKIYLNDATVTPASVWSATGGVLRLDTKASGYLRTEKDYSNYRLHVEWRWTKDTPANSNSGVMVHVHGPDAVWPLCFECQLKNGNAGQVVGMGLDIPAAPMQNNRKRAPRLADPSEKPPGEWNTYEIICRGDTIECSVNGVRQNNVGQLPVSAGAVALQMEGFPIEFRSVWLEPL